MSLSSLDFDKQELKGFTLIHPDALCSSHLKLTGEVWVIQELLFSGSIWQAPQGLVYLLLPLGGRTFKQCHKRIPESPRAEKLKLSKCDMGQGV